MSIVRMKKFTLLTFETYRESLLRELQKFEDVHFKDLQNNALPELSELDNYSDQAAAAVNGFEGELANVKYAMKKLEPHTTKPKGLKAMTAPPAAMEFSDFDAYTDSYDYSSIAANVKALDERINWIKTEVARLRAENESLRSWSKLDVLPKYIDGLKHVKSVFGMIPRTIAEDFRGKTEQAFSAVHLEFVGSIKDDESVLIIFPAEDANEAMRFFKTLGFSGIQLSFTEIPSVAISKNNEEIKRLIKEQSEAAKCIKDMAGEFEKLAVVHDYYHTLIERERANENFLKMRTTFLIEGWLPAGNAPELQKIVENVCKGEYHLALEDVEQDSLDVPIKLANGKMTAAFEAVTTMFSLPRYNEIDPTPVHMPFYMLFFGMMLGDAGYGILLSVATALALRYFHFKESMRSFLRFFFFLGIATFFIGGLLYNSWFGLQIPFLNFLKDIDGNPKPIIDMGLDIVTFMLASVAVGVVQVLFGLGVKGYMLVKAGKPFSAIFDSVFWIIALVSGIAFLLSVALPLPAIVASAAPWVFVLSLAGLAITQGREYRTPVGKLAGGVYAVYSITGFVGDFVSYSRIAAIALAGANISGAFFIMAGMLPDGLPSILFGTLIVIVGHMLNIGLGALGAYVHTCRLQYVEYFSKFYEGGGVPFKPLKLINKYIVVKK